MVFSKKIIMISSKSKQEYIAPVTETMAIVVSGILNNSNGGIPGSASNTAYDEDEDWN